MTEERSSDTVQTVIFTAFRYISSLVITYLLLLRTLFIYAWRKYNGTWKVPTFDKPPAVLQDDKYGRHNYIKLKNIKLHYVEKGDRKNPLLICVHGFPEFWYSWRHQLQDLSDDYWVVAIDLRGYGDSDKPSGKSNYTISLLIEDIVQLIDGLGKTSASLLSHDWGGLISWSVASARPEKVDKLIVLNCPHPSAFKKYIKTSLVQNLKSWYMTFYKVPYLPELWLQYTPDLFKMVFNATDALKKKVTPTDIEAFEYTYSSKGVWTPPINLYRANLPSGEFRDDPIKVPTLVVWGVKDRYLGMQMAVDSGTYVNRYTLRLIENGSHWVQQDHPEVVNKHVREFLEKND